MKKCLVVMWMLLAGMARGQELPPHHFVYTDFVYDVESIPNVGYEQFIVGKDRISSWRVNGAYQMHYSNQFGVVTSHGDRVSVGVYQGPALKGAYTLYKKTHRKNHHNYVSGGLCLKYLWYDSVQVNTGRRLTDQSFTIQSEKCFAIVPQFAIGTKYTKKWFCADYYIGLQLPVKMRHKTIDYDQRNNMTVNPNVPYTKNQTVMMPGLLVGINMGLLKRAAHDGGHALPSGSN